MKLSLPKYFMTKIDKSHDNILTFLKGSKAIQYNFRYKK
jgi:hypothetical protein